MVQNGRITGIVIFRGLDAKEFGRDVNWELIMCRKRMRKSAAARMDQDDDVQRNGI